MKQVRRGTFETNSSSVHSMTMCSEDKFKKWEEGELYYCDESEKFFTREEIIEKAKERKREYEENKRLGEGFYSWMEKYIEAQSDEELLKIETERDYGGYYTYEKFWNWAESEYETFIQTYTTEKGEEVISFGYHGYNG